MNKIKITLVLGLIFFLGLVFTLTSQATPESMERKIIVFKSEIEEPTKEKLLQKVGGIKIKDLKLIKGKAVYLTKEAVKSLAKEQAVLRIDDDVEVFALERVGQVKKSRFQPSQVLPWGVDRIEAEMVWGQTTGDSVKVAIIDTGIDLSHPDLKGNIKGGYNAINPRKSPNDDNGHGTHVAGIVAAINNNIGVVGVGPQIDLYAVKVLNASGSGYLSDVIEGLEWVINQKNLYGGDWIINMSFGTNQNVQSFYEAIKNVEDAGIVQVAAAGNNGGPVNYPAAYEEVIAVSATDQSDNLASWSSRGPEIDLSAPGVDIYSTYRGSTYKTLSGTSMAAPHVTGVTALVMETKSCDSNYDQVCSPAEVKNRLKEKAIDLGDPGFDRLYGWGLVNALSAFTQ